MTFANYTVQPACFMPAYPVTIHLIILKLQEGTITQLHGNVNVV